MFPDAFIKGFEATLAALLQPEGISLSFLLVCLQPARRRSLSSFSRPRLSKKKTGQRYGVVAQSFASELFNPGRLGARTAGQMLAGKLNPLFG